MNSILNTEPTFSMTDPNYPQGFTIEKWVKVRHLLLPCLEVLGHTHTETDVVAALMAGQMGLWMFGKSAAITEIRVYPRLRELSIFAAGGDRSELMASIPILEDHARRFSCKRIRNEGRWGWRRWEGDFPDYRFLSVSIVRDLST